MNRRDEQIAAIRSRTGRLDPDRVASCYAGIADAYKSESSIDRLTGVLEEHDRTPSDHRVLSISEARHIAHFNDPSYHWGHYCEELARGIVLAETRHIFEELGQVAADHQPIVWASPQSGGILDVIQELKAEGYNPDVLFAPNSLFVPFMKDSTMKVEWNNSQWGGRLIVPGGPSLQILWSGGFAPFDRFVILDSSKTRWSVKLDPNTSHRLTVLIGELESPPDSVIFLAETVAKYEILDNSAIRAIPVEGEPEAEGSAPVGVG